MSVTLQRSKEEVEALDRKLQQGIIAFPIFETEVAALQRRTLRRLISNYLHQVNDDISNALVKPTTDYVGREAGRFAMDLYAAYVHADSTKSKTLNLPSSIDLSPSGVFTVTRGQVHNGIPISKDDFYAYLDQIQKHVEQDTCDINLPPEVVAKLYLMKIYEHERRKQPIISGTRNPN